MITQTPDPIGVAQCAMIACSIVAMDKLFGEILRNGGDARPKKLALLMLASRELLYDAICLPEMLAGSELTLLQPLRGPPALASFWLRSRPWVIAVAVVGFACATLDNWHLLASEGLPEPNAEALGQMGDNLS